MWGRTLESHWPWNYGIWIKLPRFQGAEGSQMISRLPWEIWLQTELQRQAYLHLPARRLFTCWSHGEKGERVTNVEAERRQNEISADFTSNLETTQKPIDRRNSCSIFRQQNICGIFRQQNSGNDWMRFHRMIWMDLSNITFSEDHL